MQACRGLRDTQGHRSRAVLCARAFSSRRVRFKTVFEMLRLHQGGGHLSCSGACIGSVITSRQ